ncbi:MAG: hypothetical protein AABX96_00050 [Nanoarchaeota archaeon]
MSSADNNLVLDGIKSKKVRKDNRNNKQRWQGMLSEVADDKPLTTLYKDGSTKEETINFNGNGYFLNGEVQISARSKALNFYVSRVDVDRRAVYLMGGRQ